MSRELVAALCLVLVIEGLFLFSAPRAWKRFAEQMRALDEHALRIMGGVMIAVGLILLKLLY